MRRYIELLRAPGVAPLVAATTEAYAWQIVAYAAGSAVGAWLAGALVEAGGVETALACAPGFAAAGVLIALSGRRSLAPRLPR